MKTLIPWRLAYTLHNAKSGDLAWVTAIYALLTLVTWWLAFTTGVTTVFVVLGLVSAYILGICLAAWGIIIYEYMKEGS